jgi:hypothetical protein
MDRRGALKMLLAMPDKVLREASLSAQAAAVMNEIGYEHGFADGYSVVDRSLRDERKRKNALREEHIRLVREKRLE